MSKKEFLLNEKIWLESINCIIKEYEEMIVVTNKFLVSEDFNFIHINNAENIDECISKMKENKLLYMRTAIDLERFKNLKNEEEYDVNYEGNSSFENIQNLLNKKNEMYLDKNLKWKNIFPKDRKFNSKVIPYAIIYKNNIIGQICFVYHNAYIGIYDFEIYDNFRGQGYASLFFSKLLTSANPNCKIFIQTWNKNLVANKLYSKVGFSQINSYKYYKLVI